MKPCNCCKKEVEPGTGIWYERDEEKHGVSGVGYKTDEFVLCGACDKKLMDGDLKWRDVAAR